MPPRVAEIDAAKRDATWPDRAEMLQNSVQNCGCADLGLFGQKVKQAAGPGLVGLPESLRIGRDYFAKSVKQGGTALQSDERIVGAGLKTLCQLLRRQRDQGPGIDPERVRRVVGKCATDEKDEAGDRQT